MPKKTKKNNVKNENNNKFIIHSDAYPPSKEGVRETLYSSSENHSLIKGLSLSKSNIYFSPLKMSNLDEIKKLHQEFFPLHYEDNFFKTVLNNKYGQFLHIGAYYRNNDNNNDDILIGLVLCEWQSISDFEKFDNGEIRRKIENEVNIVEETWTGLKCEDYSCCYIMNLGVIEEFRKLGVGSELISKAINECLKSLSCVMIYLNVVEYNKSAIKFYDKNQFERVTNIKNYYKINNNYYDSFVYARIFKRKEKDEFRKKYNGSICGKICSFVRSTFCYIVNISTLNMFCSFCRKKYKLG